MNSDDQKQPLSRRTTQPGRAAAASAAATVLHRSNNSSSPRNKGSSSTCNSSPNSNNSSPLSKTHRASFPNPASGQFPNTPSQGVQTGNAQFPGATTASFATNAAGFKAEVEEEVFEVNVKTRAIYGASGFFLGVFSGLGLGMLKRRARRGRPARKRRRYPRDLDLDGALHWRNRSA